MWVTLLFSVIMAGVFAPVLPLSVQGFLLSTSILTKSAIFSVLPVIIFSLLLRAILNVSKGFIVFIFASICVSNFISTWISYISSKFVYSLNLSCIAKFKAQTLEPLFNIQIPSLVDNDKVMIAALIVGIIGKIFHKNLTQNLSLLISKITEHLLKIILYIMPLFIIGSIVKLRVEGLLFIIIKDYYLIFLTTCLSTFTYIIILYLIESRFSFKEFIISVKNIFPAWLSALSTMSSAATMPLTINLASKNTKNPEIVKAIIPATVNVHLVGDCFAIPIFAFAILKSFGVIEPNLFSYLMFSIYFVWAKFSVAAIPGGGIIVMIPVLEEHLGLSGDMLPLITTLYILFDPVITSANVMGNGVFARILSKINFSQK